MARLLVVGLLALSCVALAQPFPEGDESRSPSVAIDEDEDGFELEDEPRSSELGLEAFDDPDSGLELLDVDDDDDGSDELVPDMRGIVAAAETGEDLQPADRLGCDKKCRRRRRRRRRRRAAARAKMCAALTPQKRKWTCDCSSKCRKKRKAAKNRKKWLGWVKSARRWYYRYKAAKALYVLASG